MQHEHSFSRLAGFAAMLAAPIGWLSLILVFAAYNWDFDVIFDPLKAIAYQPDPAGLSRWGWALDLLGFYLLLAPAILFMRHKLSAKAPLHSQTIAFFGLGYILSGAIGAAMLVGASVPLYAAHAAGDPTGQAIAAQIYANLNHEVLDGIWNVLGVMFSSVWIAGTGWLLHGENKPLAWFSWLIAAGCVLDLLGSLLLQPALAGLGLNLYLWLFPAWTFWIGWVVLKGK